MARLTAGLITAIALGVLLIGGWAVLLLMPSKNAPAQPTDTASSTSVTATSSSELPAPQPAPALAANTATSPNVAAKTAPAGTATLVVSGTRYALHAPAGSTLEEAMQQLQGEGGFSYTSQEYSGLGAFVTGINGRASGQGSYWILYVNGEKSSTGISSTRIRSGDLIEWKLEKSY